MTRSSEPDVAAEPSPEKTHDGTWYREESKDMARTIRDGKLMECVRVAAAATSD